MDKAVYEVRHSTELFYHRPVRENTFVLMMRPLQGEHQKICHYRLELLPQAKVSQYKDHYGNTKQFFSILEPHQSLTIRSSFQAEVFTPPPFPSSIEGKEWEHLQKLKESGDMWEWLSSGHFTRHSKVLEDFLLQEGITKQKDPLTSLKFLNEKLFSVFSYAPKSTKVDSAIEEILTSKKGVCQDYAHVLISIARLWGIPSRYVSGYLYQKEKDSKIPESESHAWCECYLPSAGWLGFDPTNNSLSGLQYIKTAIGRDYKDVPPHNGFFKGRARQKLKVHVQIKKI